jgi:ferredoxin
MKVWIDQDLCTGDGLCEELAPDLGSGLCEEATPDAFFGPHDGLHDVIESTEQ